MIELLFRFRAFAVPWVASLTSLLLMSKGAEKQGRKGHPDPNDGTRDQYKRHVDGSITVHGQLETHLPPDLEKKQETRDEVNDGRDKKRFVVEILTLAFIVAGAGLTGCYVFLTHHIVKTGDEALYRQTRPWLGLVGTVAPNTPMSFVSGKFPDARVDVPITILLYPNSTIKEGEGYISYDGVFDIKNYGASPALHGAYSVAMAIERTDAPRASQGACDAANKAADSGHDSKESKTGIVLFPSAQEREPFIASAHGTQMPESVFLLGCFVYDDPAGNRHTTKFCQYGLPGNARALISCDLETSAD